MKLEEKAFQMFKTDILELVCTVEMDAEPNESDLGYMNWLENCQIKCLCNQVFLFISSYLVILVYKDGVYY